MKYMYTSLPETLREKVNIGLLESSRGPSSRSLLPSDKSCGLHFRNTAPLPSRNSYETAVAETGTGAGDLCHMFDRRLPGVCLPKHDSGFIWVGSVCSDVEMVPLLSTAQSARGPGADHRVDIVYSGWS